MGATDVLQAQVTEAAARQDAAFHAYLEARVLASDALTYWREAPSDYRADRCGRAFGLVGWLRSEEQRARADLHDAQMFARDRVPA